jgi:HK97 family phage major capsid protein
MSKILELRRDKAALVQKAQHLFDIVDEQKRAMNDQESKDYDKFMGDIENLDKEIRRREQLEDVTAEPVGKRDSKIGMSDKDLRKYSLVRAISAFANRDWRGAELEREASEATAKRLGSDPRGFYVPSDWASQERRDLTVGTANAGGNMVATDLLSGSFIELLRNRLILRQAGATVLGDLVGNIAIPAQTGGATAYWVGEGSAVTESQQVVGQVVMSPKTVGAFTDYSRRLMQQSSVDVENFVRGDLASTLQIAIDFAGLHGDPATDTNQPRGVAMTSGIGSVAGGTNGAAPTWANIVALETAVATNNADLGTLAYLTNARVRGRLKTTEKATSTAQFVWTDNGTLNGYKALTSNQVRSNLTKGTSTGVCSAILYGNWADLLMGLWGGLDVIVDPYSQSTSGTMRVVAFQSVDFAVRNVASFAAMLDALTT